MTGSLVLQERNSMAIGESKLTTVTSEQERRQAAEIRSFNATGITNHWKAFYRPITGDTDD